MESVSPHVGGHLDLHRHAGDFHFAVPALRTLPANDRDVGSEDRGAGSQPALWRACGDSTGFSWRKGAHPMMKTPFGHNVYAMAAEYPSAASLYEAAKRVRDAGF